MPTQRDGDVKRPADWTTKSKNDSKRRDIVPEQQNPAGPKSKNPGSTDKERPHQMTSNRNKSVPNKDLGDRRPIKEATRTSRRNSGTAHKDMFGERTVNKGAARKNDSSAPEHPEPRINSGKTKVKTYPAGANRGRNYKR